MKKATTGKSLHGPVADQAAGPTDGTQAIRRAAAILKAIAKSTSHGVSLADISRTENLPRSTAHRILKCLVEEGFVEHYGDSRRYQIGSLAYELGLAVSKSALEVSRWRGLIESVARRTGVTSYLMRRSGIESLCLLKADGNSVIRVIPVEVGQRRSLGVGAGATALLAALDEETCERVIGAIAPSLKNQTRLTRAGLKAAVKSARTNGFAISRGMVADQVFGLGFVIPDAESTPSLAVSIAAHESVATEANIGNWKRIIRDEIRAAISYQSALLQASSLPLGDVPESIGRD